MYVTVRLRRAFKKEEDDRQKEKDPPLMELDMYIYISECLVDIVLM